MAAHPKNKVTRVEQGKRRHGNNPKLIKDTATTKVPLYKRGFFEKIMKAVGHPGKVDKNKSEEHKKSKAMAPAVTQMNQAAAMPAPAPVKKIRSTQHKGG